MTLAALRALLAPLAQVVDYYDPAGHYGYSWPLPGGRAAIALNRAAPPAEQLWTLAHEAGHVVCHILPGGARPGPQAEKEADAFAAALLGRP